MADCPHFRSIHNKYGGIMKKILSILLAVLMLALADVQ
jgi:hypothetical protein